MDFVSKCCDGRQLRNCSLTQRSLHITPQAHTADRDAVADTAVPFTELDVTSEDAESPFSSEDAGSLAAAAAEHLGVVANHRQTTRHDSSLVPDAAAQTQNVTLVLPEFLQVL